MPAIETYELHRAPEAFLADFHALDEARDAELDPDGPERSLEEFVATVRSMPTDFDDHASVIRDREGTPAALAECVLLKREENAHLAQIELFVRPEERLKGYGRALLGEVLSVASAGGRSLLIGVTSDRVPAGEAFAVRFGGERGLKNTTYRLDVGSVDWKLVDEWIGLGSSNAGDYLLRTLEGPCPDMLVEPIVDVLGSMNDAPSDDLRVEDRRHTIQQFRESERQLEASGAKRLWVIVEHGASSELVGLTEVSCGVRAERVVRQGDTVVKPDHRGQGLGRWMKAIMLKRLAEEFPATEIRTSTADSNEAMLRINRQVGFRPLRSQIVWQASLEAVQSTLGDS